MIQLVRRISGYVRVRYDPVGHYRSMGIRIGEGCRFGPGINWGSEPFLITLSDRVWVAAQVAFLTHDGGVWVLRKEFPEIDVFGEIRIGSNTFIGQRSTIMPGVTIGSNCVIGTGSIVTRSVPDDSVVAGVPARVIRSIDEYKARLLAHPNRLPTGRLDPARKKIQILRHFSNTIGEVR